MAKATRRRRRPTEDDDEPTTRRRRSSSSRNGGGSGGSFKVDFRDATPGGKRRFPEGDYKVKISKATREKSQSGNSQIKVTYEFLEPEKYEGKTLTDYLTLTRKAAWRIGNLFDAVGIKWSQKVMEFKTSKIVGKELGITLADDEYNGRVRSKVADYLDAETIESILSGEDLDEDESDDGDELEGELDDMDRAELKAYIKDEDLDVKVTKKMSDQDIRIAILEEQTGMDEDEDEDDEDDDDEDLDEFDDDEL